jgi:hypothetical protein
MVGVLSWSASHARTLIHCVETAGLIKWVMTANPETPRTFPNGFEILLFDRVVGWAPTEDEALDLLRDLARKQGDPVGLWVRGPEARSLATVA